jgi:hypothetical protein
VFFSALSAGTLKEIHQSMSFSAHGKLVVASILSIDGRVLKPPMTGQEI